MSQSSLTSALGDAALQLFLLQETLSRLEGTPLWEQAVREGWVDWEYITQIMQSSAEGLRASHKVVADAVSLSMEQP